MDSSTNSQQGPSTRDHPGACAQSNAARKASVIIPSSGLRVHRSWSNLPRNYTLARSDSPAEPISETAPLLGNVSHRLRGDFPVNRRLVDLCKTCFAAANSKTGRKIIKCSLAYILGSLATFVYPISALLGKYDGKHMVATFAVYFHPARSAGSMHEATLFALTAFVYSTVVSIGSMGVSVLFARWGLVQLGHALVLIIFCAGGLGFIGYTKIAMSSPTVSVACSLASISIVTILTKEGSIQLARFSMGKIYQVSMIVIMAIVISNFLAFTLWPTSAISELRQLMIRSTDSFSEMLSILTRSFLNGSEREMLGSSFIKAAANHRTVFTSLTKHLNEAKYEHYIRGTEKEYELETKLVDCMQRLAQHIGGLRSAASTQISLLALAHENQLNAKSGTTPISLGRQRRPSDSSQLFTPPENGGVPTPAQFSSISAAASDLESEASAVDGPDAVATIFYQFIFHLGPPMKSLAYTLKLILGDLPFAPGQPYKVRVNPEFRTSLRNAIELYSDARQEALNTLYRSEALTKERPMAEAADVEEIAASCGYFSFCMLYFATEMLVFLDLLEQMESLQAEQPRTWEWAKFWKKSGRPTNQQVDKLTLKRRETIPNVAPEVGIPFSYKVWKALGVFRRDYVRYSIKVGVGAALYALVAFIPSTRPIYSHWRGEWGLVSYMIVFSMTLGQTNNSGKARILGTVLGSVLALTAWFTCATNPYLLATFGWAVSLPCFWIILTWKQATFGRFILLTYNLSVLYAYSLAMADGDGDDDDEGGANPIITEIVLHRFVAVTVGVLWALFINLAIWPRSARNQLRNGLSVLWFRMGLIWRRDPLTNLTEGESEKQYMNISEEHALQKALLRLGQLTDSAPHEFRLKGPFPASDYKQLMSANQAILDAFHGMSVMMICEPTAIPETTAILQHTKREREDLCARISHLFYVLASSMKLGFPLPPTLPRMDRARDRLLAKLFEYKKCRSAVDADWALIYAYTLVTGRVAEGVADAVQIMERLYGVLEEEMLEI